jgi:hypothetical protein
VKNKTRNHFIAKHDEYMRIKDLRTTVIEADVYRRSLEAEGYSQTVIRAQLKDIEEKRQAAEKEQSLRDARIAEILADRTPDDFTSWYLAQKPDIQNDIRTMAKDCFKFPGPEVRYLRSRGDYLRYANHEQPSVRFSSRYHALRVSGTVPQQIALHKAQYRYEKAHGNKGEWKQPWIDAAFAAAILDISKRTFLNRIKDGTYAFASKTPNSRVVLYDGNDVLESRLADFGISLKQAELVK